jgi:hypothetical protein
MWDQYHKFLNAKQGNASNTKWLDMVKTKMEVGESVGCTFAQDKTLEYCAQDKYKAAYNQLQADKQNQNTVQEDAREPLLAYTIIKTSNQVHGKIKADLANDYTKGSDTYPKTSQNSLLLLDQYSKDKQVTGITQSWGPCLCKQQLSPKKKDNNGNKKVEFDKEFYKDKKCFKCGKVSHPTVACTAKMVSANNTASSKSDEEGCYGNDSDFRVF